MGTNEDADKSVCSEGCYTHWVGNGICELSCNVQECNFDDGDCDDVQDSVCDWQCGIPNSINTKNEEQYNDVGTEHNDSRRRIKKKDYPRKNQRTEREKKEEDNKEEKLTVSKHIDGVDRLLNAA